MGKHMTARPKKARPKYTFTREELVEIKNDIAKKIMLLAAITYADQDLIDEEKQEYLPDADEKILAFWERITRYSEAVNDQLITMHFVTKVLREGVNLDVHW